MIEKVTLHLTENAGLSLPGRAQCGDLNPKAMLLYAAAQCAGLTVLQILKKEHSYPKRFEISVSGELSTDTVRPESLFNSFHVVYNIECNSPEEQLKASRAVMLTNNKYCGVLQMLRRIAPVSHEMAMVSTQPAKV